MKGTTRKTNSQVGGLLSFLASLAGVALPLTKNVLVPFAILRKRFDIIMINSRRTSNRCSYSDENIWVRYDESNNFR